MRTEGHRKLMSADVIVSPEAWERMSEEELDELCANIESLLCDIEKKLPQGVSFDV